MTETSVTRSSTPTPPAPLVSTRPARPSTRPAGEVGGHTVQPGEEESSAFAGMKGSTSRDTPAPTLPEEGARDGDPGKTLSAPTVAASVGATTARPTSQAARPAAAPAEAPAQATAKVAEPASAPPAQPTRMALQRPAPASKAPAAAAAAPKSSPRPLVTDGQGLETLQKEALVEQITASLAETLARALRQTVEQAVAHASGGLAQKDAGAAVADDAQKSASTAPEA